MLLLDIHSVPRGAVPRVWPAAWLAYVDSTKAQLPSRERGKEEDLLNRIGHAERQLRE